MKTICLQKSFILFIILLAITSSTLIQLKSQEQTQTQSQYNPDDLPKLPVYVSRGYNAFTGNPLHSLKVDPGFGLIIENFTYQKGKTTEDGKFLIPDQAQAIKVTSCSFDTSVNQFRGSKSYQDELIIKASMSGGFPIDLIKASFSLSTSYKRIENNTIEKNQSITHAIAECEIYKLTSDLFSGAELSENFVNGAISSYKANNWTNFVAQYGTHYIYEAVMGGRATQQISYSSTSVSKLQSLGIDIHTAAKAEFAKFFGDNSYDWQSHKTVIEYSQQMQSSKQEIYIGGAPPKNGDIYQWQKNIINDPMPINYKMLPLSDLFSKIKNIFFKPADAKAKFLTYLNSYCMQNKCSNPIPDRPQPAPAKVQMSDSISYGGNQGSGKRWYMQSPTLDLKQIHIASEGVIDRIQVVLTDGITTYYSPIFGGNGGTDRPVWVIPDQQYLSQIQYHYDNQVVVGLSFITNKGVKSQLYGHVASNYALLTLPSGFRVIGILGLETSFVARLGFILARNIYESAQSYEQEIVYLRQN